MEYMKLASFDREEYLRNLEDMPSYLEQCFNHLPKEQTTLNGPNGEFSPVEQIWHMADLEIEGFSRRIEIMLSGSNIEMPGFDGTKAAMERNYKALSLEDGLAKFKAARKKNIGLFRKLDIGSWTKKGILEGVGEIAVCDMPAFITQHDAAHRSEIEAWREAMHNRAFQ